MMIISRSSDFLPIFLALFLTTRIQCFAPSNNFQRSPSSFLIFANPQENEEPTDPFADPMIRSTEASSSTTSSSSLSYPINLPSPILLGSSMILAIIGTGCAFDIFSDSPRFGVAINAVIAAVGLSSCLGLFYASILKAQAETEEDDRKYMNGR